MWCEHRSYQPTLSHFAGTCWPGQLPQWPQPAQQLILPANGMLFAQIHVYGDCTHAQCSRASASLASRSSAGSARPCDDGQQHFCMPMCSCTEIWQHPDQELLDLLDCTVCSTEACRHAPASQQLLCSQPWYGLQVSGHTACIAPAMSLGGSLDSRSSMPNTQAPARWRVWGGCSISLSCGSVLSASMICCTPQRSLRRSCRLGRQVVGCLAGDR